MLRSALFIGLLLAPGPQAAACALSVGPGALPASVRIAAVTVTVAHALILSGRRSGGWRLAIDNDPSWRASLKAVAVVGAAFVDAGDLGALFSLEPEPGFTCRSLDRDGDPRLRLTIYDDDATSVRLFRHPAMRVGGQAGEWPKRRN